MINSFSGEFRFLSNFWTVPVTWGGKVWPSSEHAYQAAKFMDESIHDKIQSNPDPRAAKKFGRAKGLREDWDAVKIGLMREIVRAKFDQHPELMEKLKQTSPHELIEGNWWNDTFWGVCRGKGENWLGKILMEVREDK